MSEYQCHEFVALERPLAAKQMAELRAISTRAEITPTRFWNEYQWGNLKADPAKLVERYFDAYLYSANWGTHRLMLRLPVSHVEPKGLRPYFVKRAANARVVGKHLLLDLYGIEDEPDAEEAPASLAALAPLHTELVRGDLRVAYLAWLLAVQAGDVADDATEPPVPPGLSDLTAAQTAMVDFLRIDPDLIAAAATASAPETHDAEALRAWTLGLSRRAKDEWLLRAIAQPERALGAELRGSFRKRTSAERRTERRVGDLHVATEAMRVAREDAESLAKEKARRATEAARNRRLDRLGTRLDVAWSELESKGQRQGLRQGPRARHRSPRPRAARRRQGSLHEVVRGDA